MKLRDIIRAPKSGIHTGAWKAGKIPRSEYPLSRARDRDYKYGPAYDWRIVKFTALGLDCRVLILLRERREIYYARLGVVEHNDTKIICSYEFHGAEPGWHCHAKCGPLSTIQAGLNRQDSARFPDGRRFHRDKVFGVTKATALRRAIDFYRIEEPGTLV